MRRHLAAIAAAIALTAGCATEDGYTPAMTSYGERGACYYVDDPAEAVALQAAGLCPVNWIPAPMPYSWRSQYAWYYDSPGYYNTYVPQARRSVYVEHVKVYEKSNPRAVVKVPTVAKQTKKATFSAGNARQGGDDNRATKRATTTRQQSAPKPRSTFKSGSRR